MTVVLEILGPPLGKGRPRFNRKFGTAYTPARTRRAEGVVEYAAAQAMNGTPPIAGPVAVTIELAFPIAPSWSRKKRAAAISGELAHVSNPDLDNCLKLICDALNGVAWHDDRQITSIAVRKFYSDRPRTRVEIVPEENDHDL